MKKTIYTRQSDYLCQTLVAMRKKAGLTQRQLAARLEREHSLIARLELGERRLEMVEFFWICRACRVNPESAALRLMRTLKQVESDNETVKS